MKKETKVLFLILLVIAGSYIWGIVWVLDIGGCRCGEQGLRIASTVSKFNALSIIIEYAFALSGQKPPKEISSIIAYLRNHCPWLYKIVLEKQLWDQELQAVMDAWGNPAELVVLSPHQYRFISAGPNGKFEQGKGDDVIYDFDPLELGDANDPDRTAH